MSHLQALLIPFDLSLFVPAARQRLRRTLGFLALLVLLSAAATTASVTLTLRDLVRRLEPHLDEIPTITIRNGQASADVAQPWVKHLGRDDAGHEIVLIIDTTGQRTDFAPNEVGAFLQRTEVVLKLDGERRSVSLARVPDTTLGPQTARRLIATLMRRVPFYLGAVLLAYYAFVKSLQAVLLVLAALAGSSSRRALGFGALFSVSVYALTPAVLLDSLLPLVHIQLPMFWLIYAAVVVAYAVLGGQRAAAAPPDATP